MKKIDAEVDEFGVLCATMRGRGWWVEVAHYQFAAPCGVIRIDADNASPGDVDELKAIVRGLREWCTDGGKAEWLKKSSPTTS